MATGEERKTDPVQTPEKEIAPSEPKRGLIGGAFRAIGTFLEWTLFLPLMLFRNKRRSIDEITVYSAHPSFFLWPLIIVGFVLAAVVRNSPGTAGTCGWIYIWVLLYFFVTILYDFSTRKLALWILIFTAIWLTSKYVEHLQHVAVVGSVFDYLSRLHPMLDPGTVTVMSWLLLLPWVGSLFHMALNGRKRFTPNEIGEFHFGEGSELTDRTGLRFRTKYRDVLEMVLSFGGGDLIAVDNHQNVIKHWDNIIGLFFVWNHMDRILHQRAVVDVPDEDLDAQPVR